MRILVFGKNGQVAQCLRQEAGGAGEFVALGRDSADLLEPGAAQTAINDHKPDIVINAAAYTAVDNAENDIEIARRLNAEAPKEIADATKKLGAQYIHISTDYVFDGESERPYSETDAPAPLNIYGQTKLDGENAILDVNDQAVIIRTSWVFSEHGSNFVKTMLRVGAERDALNVVDDQIGGPTAASDIAKAVIKIAAKKHRGADGAGLYHYQGNPSVSWAGFAQKIFEYAGLAVSVTPIETKDYPTPARRPLKTRLDCSRLERDFGIPSPDWRIALRQTVEAIQSA